MTNPLHFSLVYRSAPSEPESASADNASAVSAGSASAIATSDRHTEEDEPSAACSEADSDETTSFRGGTDSQTAAETVAETAESSRSVLEVELVPLQHAEHIS